LIVMVFSFVTILISLRKPLIWCRNGIRSGVVQRSIAY
jgi:hypothetical protein